MAKIGTVNLHVKIIGIGSKNRIKFLALIARILGINLEVREDINKIKGA